jgi:hypothetical protein
MFEICEPVAALMFAEILHGCARAFRCALNLDRRTCGRMKRVELFFFQDSSTKGSRNLM